MKKYEEKMWYVVFDGTTHYGLLGVDVEYYMSEDPDLEVAASPLDYDQADIVIEQLNNEL